MRSRRFLQVDVFSATPTKGNGLAVIVDAEGLSTEQMQDFAAWTNLAETTFILPPEDPSADYKVRIFTPGREMPFAGHPTLGSCISWLHCGGIPKSPGQVVQECNIGLVDVDVSGDVPAFAAPETKIALLAQGELERITAALELPVDAVRHAVQLDNGPVWSVLELADAEAAMAVNADLVRWPEFVAVAVMGAHPENSKFAYELRNISPSSGMSEDPITGSLNAAVAQWLHAEGRLAGEIVNRQGTCIGRDGRIYIRENAGRILVGGEVNVLIDGTVTL